MSMPDPSFNLLTIVAALRKRWTLVVFFVVASVAVAALTVWVVPAYYRSTATVVPANPALADKARLFNTNIQGLYSYFGSGDDLDRIYGVADMDTTYKQLVDEFSLVEYYRLTGDSFPQLRRKAVLRLRKDLDLQKTDKDQLLIRAWTRDRQLSANIVNRMVALIEATENTVWQNHYRLSMEQLEASISAMEAQYIQLGDSISRAFPARKTILTARQASLLDQLQQYQKTRDEFRLAAQISPAVLYVMEKAVPAAKAERPDKTVILLAAGLLSFVFICLLVLVNDRKKSA